MQTTEGGASTSARPWCVPLSRLQTLYLESTHLENSSSSNSSSPPVSGLNTSSSSPVSSSPSSRPTSQVRPPDHLERTRALAQAHRRHPKAGPVPDKGSANKAAMSSISSIDNFLVAPGTSTSDPLESQAARLYVQHERVKTEPFPPVRVLSPQDRKRILVTGGAGFVGSHLVDRLMLMGHDVLVLDNFFTGQKSNVSHWIGHPNFELVRHDVVNPILVEVDQVYHLACPASPPFYQANQIKTIKTNFMGTSNMLGLAKRTKARFLLASTSEVYGDPDVSPQKETYNGNVNQTGPRACYDEGKRVAETLAYG